MSLTAALQSTLTGLQVSQAQIQLTSNNIANVNTPGYTRKTAALQTQTLNGETTGVQLSDIQRTVDDRLLRQLREHISLLSGQKVTSSTLQDTQVLFGTLGDNSSFSHGIKELGSAFEGLGTNPMSLVDKNSALENARVLASQLNTMSRNLQQMRVGADRDIESAVTKINTLLSDIHDLNAEIAGRTASSQTSPDLEDQRDRLLTDLAEEIDIQYFKRQSGEVVILTKTGRTLLDSVPTTLSHPAISQSSATVTLGNGISGIIHSSSGVDITAEIGGGRLAGLIESRDNTLVNLQAEIDRLSEVLRDSVNQLHNNGTAFPPPQTLTSTRSFVAADAPSMTGEFRVTVVDADGVVVETLDINLAAQANIGAFVGTVNGMANATAAINADGTISMSATGANRITINEMTGAVTDGNKTYGMGQFLGLNDFFDAGPNYTDYISDRAASDTAALGLAGTLSFRVGGATTAVNYVVGDSLTDIAASINGALGGSNIAATVVREGSGFRLQITDQDGDNFFVTDSGTLTSNFNIRAGMAGTAERIAVRQSLLQNPGLVAHAESSSGTLAVGNIAVSAGDGSIAQAIAAAFTTNTTFAAAGNISQRSVTLESYAAEIISVNAAKASAASSQVENDESFRLTLENQVASISQVNLDEELANIILLQNAYSASARLTTVIAEMLDTLIQIA
jgi:flagellar hook-associated protein 1 FlgK